MLVYLQLSLLLQPQGVDYSYSKTKCFLGVSMGAKGIDTGTGCRDVFCDIMQTHMQLTPTGRQMNNQGINSVSVRDVEFTSFF